MGALPLEEICLRIGTALLVGAVIGIERHLHDQAAGLRTHTLVALAAALAVLMTISPGASPTDLFAAQSRVLQGLMTGIGFLGAGVIVRSDRERTIHGLTTAAAIWLTAAGGALCGAGRLREVACGLIGVVIVLVIGGPIEDAFQRAFGRRKEGGTGPGDGQTDQSAR